MVDLNKAGNIVFCVKFDSRIVDKLNFEATLFDVIFYGVVKYRCCFKKRHRSFFR